MCLCALYLLRGRLLGPRFGGPGVWALIQAVGPVWAGAIVGGWALDKGVGVEAPHAPPPPPSRPGALPCQLDSGEGAGLSTATRSPCPYRHLLPGRYRGPPPDSDPGSGNGQEQNKIRTRVSDLFLIFFQPVESLRGCNNGFLPLLGFEVAF